MAANIERRGHTWFATLHVPKDVQPTLGKSKFFETLKTTDKRIAETRAAPLVAQWKACIAAARGQSDPYIPGGHPNCPTYGHPNCSTWPG